MEPMQSDRDFLAHAYAVTPGASQTRSKAPGAVGPSVPYETMFPLFAKRGEGFHVYDRIGRKFIDLFGANAAIPLGYGYPPVVEAVTAAVRGGSLLSLPSVRESVVSDLFLRICAPWAQSVRWVKTGSEAVSAAARLARIATGRSKLVMMAESYHGWHDVSYARFREPHRNVKASVGANGVPTVLQKTVKLMPYHEQNFAKYLDKTVAALFIEPHRWIRTDTSWLEGICNYARTVGAVVVFDELVYGLRWKEGGGSHYYGVSPDLACYGKALGNGVPIACVCGSASLMAPAAEFVSGTYGGDDLGLAAAEAVLHAYEREHVIETLWRNGRALWRGYEQMGPIGYPLVGFPVHWKLPFKSPKLDAVLASAAGHGLLVHRSSNNASAAMDEDQAEQAGRSLGLAASSVIDPWSVTDVGA